MQAAVNSRTLPLLALLALGAATIAGAWGFQLIGGYVPCKLCLEQRWPFYIGLPLAVLALLLLVRGKSGRLSAILLLLVAAVFAYGSGLGIYQAGAEWAFWPGPSDCGGGVASPTSTGNLLNALNTTRVVSCTEASWRMFGLSFAGWNALISAALAVLAVASLIGLRRGRA